MEPTPQKTHPLILLAAVSFTLLSLAAAASLLGWRPFSPEPANVTAPTLAASTTPAPVPEPAKSAPAEEPKPLPKTAAPVPKPAPRPVAKTSAEAEEKAPLLPVANKDNEIEVIPATPSCRNCGTVEQIREVTAEAQGSGLGAIAGGILGGVLGNQVGGGNGKKLATVAGAVGGAYAGHQIEKRTRATTSYEIRISLDDGSQQTITQESAPTWRVGDRVVLENGVIRAR